MNWSSSSSLIWTKLQLRVSGKRRLAYQINKRREGQYVLVEMQLPPAFSAELERNMRFLEPVMRFSIINRD